jgi:hypothetical protein
MPSWYYVAAKTREKSGPHDESTVRAKFVAGEISPTTLVWHPGLPAWVQARQVFSSLLIASGASAQVPLPEGLRGWMTFVGVVTLLLFFAPAMMLYGLPMFLAGVAVLGASSALGRAAYVDAALLPFFSKLKTAFACVGWTYLIGIFFAVLGLLAYLGLLLFAFSAAHAASPHLPP